MDACFQASRDCLSSSFQFILPNYCPEHWENSEEEEFDPYEGGAVSNYPGGSNLFYIPTDIYYTGRALIESIQHGDNEEIIDASTRLFGIPANIISTGGTIASYGKAFGVVAHLPWYLTPITIIAGLVLCIVEGLVDIVSLVRQNYFEKNFDFELLSHLRYMAADIEPTKTIDAIKGITKLINEDSSTFKELLDNEQATIIQNLLNEIHRKVEEHPELLPTIVNHYRPALQEVSKHLLVANLMRIRHDYLLVTEHEKEHIEESVRVKNPELGIDELQALQKKELQIASTIKKKQLARRIRPWMVEEANETVTPLLRGITNDEPEAIKEGLRLIDDMHVQSKKKKVAHILGIIALVFAAASLIALAVVCPASIPYILAGVAMTFALARAGVFSGMLESRGWTFEPKKILPLSIRKKIFSDPGSAPKISHQYQKSLMPESYREWIEQMHKQQLDLQKRGFESQPKTLSHVPLTQRIYV
ncbi:MAG: hypothetical protein KFB93_06705 [Simkaniaceae bacterium]|nr:MAG: hypothetical protein KFB93_06705 [Simkaniaceae bacterium]